MRATPAHAVRRVSQIVDLHVTRGFGGNELAVTVREVTPDEVGLALAGRERVA